MALDLPPALTTATWVANTPPASASAIYADWLAALGVADEAAVFEGDDLRVMFDGVPFLAGASSKLAWSSDGGIAFFRTLPANQTQKTWTLNPALRTFSTTTQPDLYLCFQDISVTNRSTVVSRKAISGSTLLIFATIQRNTAATNIIDVALRITAGTIDVVVTDVSATNTVIVLYGATSTAFVSGQYINYGFPSGTVSYTLTPTYGVPLAQPSVVSSRAQLAFGSAAFDPKPNMIPVAPSTVDRAPLGFPPTAWEQSLPSAQNPMQFRGRGKVTGTIKIDDTPVDLPAARRVRLYRESDGALVRTVWSDPTTGAYEFYGVAVDERYTVISHDYTGTYPAVLADGLIPDPAP